MVFFESKINFLKPFRNSLCYISLKLYVMTSIDKLVKVTVWFFKRKILIMPKMG